VYYYFFYSKIQAFQVFFLPTNTMPKHKNVQNIKNRNYFHKNRYFWNGEKAVILQREKNIEF